MKLIYEFAVFVLVLSFTMKVSDFIDSMEFYNNRFFSNKLVRFCMFVALFCLTVMMKVSIKDELGISPVNIFYKGAYYAGLTTLMRWSGALFSSRKGRRKDVVS